MKESALVPPGNKCGIFLQTQRIAEVQLNSSQSSFSGIGKSSLVNEIRRPVMKKKRYFISGKFDQFNRDIPYSAIIQAFQELCRQLLSESEQALEVWQKKLLKAVGPNGQLIIDVIPQLELIIGKQQPVKQLGPAESRNRFNMVFMDVVRIFADESHPLVVFLDDLQWVYSASVNLIKLLTTDQDTGFLFIIGTYRDNEVDETYPLIIAMDELKKENKATNSIRL